MNWALFLSQTCQLHGSNEAVFSSGVSYREHFAAIAAIQHIIKVVLNSHMYFDSQLFSCRVGFFFSFSKGCHYNNVGREQPGLTVIAKTTHWIY